jgi:hypothetical protein
MMPLPQKSALCPYLTPSPSPSLRAVLLGLHGLALLAAGLNPLAIWLRLVLAGVVLASLGLELRRYRSPAIVGLQLKSDGFWALQGRDGPEIESSLLPSSLVNPWFVLLHFRSGDQSHSLLICRDSLSEDDFRKLRVALKVAGLKMPGDVV